MASYSTNWHGSGPTLKCSGNFDYSVSGMTINVSASLSSSTVYSGSYYNYTIYCYVSVDGNDVGGGRIAGNGGSGNISGSMDVGAGDHSVELHYCCDQQGPGCDRGFGDVVVASGTVHVDDPYSAPSHDIWSATEIIKVSRDTVNVNYKINGGTNALDWVIARVDGVKDYGASKNKGDSLWTSFTPQYSEGFADESSYNVRIRYSDSHAEYQTGHKTFRTYREPKLSSVSPNRSEVNADSQTITFTMAGINTKKWDGYENDFYTQVYCSSGSTRTGNDWTTVGVAGTNNQFSLSGATLRGFVTKAYDGQTITLHCRRVNGKANWYGTEKTCTFKVYYRPRKGVTCANTTYRKNTNTGAVINKQDWVVNDATLSGIYVSWTYDTTTADAGYTQGYRIRLYNKEGTVVKTYYTGNKYYTIPKSDIPKMQYTYIDITPYFKNDSTNTGSYWYYTGTIAKCDFVVMAARLARPEITYPVEGSDWINTKFRVCFQLPSDPDKGSETETYKYEDIEVDINGKIFRLTSNPNGGSSGAVVCQDAFSSTNLTYERKMVIAPFKASNFPTATTYKIKVRVKKDYTEDKVNWSEWSAIRTFTITPATFNPAVGDIIYATHYNNAKKVINRVRNTYGVAWNNQPADVTRGTIILRSQYPYANWYDRIVATKKQVNDYATFDSSKTAVRFDSTNQIKENFTQYVELVTAASNEDKSDASGRNYMKIVYDRCNRLI